MYDNAITQSNSNNPVMNALPRDCSPLDRGVLKSQLSWCAPTLRGPSTSSGVPSLAAHTLGQWGPSHFHHQLGISIDRAGKLWLDIGFTLPLAPSPLYSVHPPKGHTLCLLSIDMSTEEGKEDRRGA